MTHDETFSAMGSDIRIIADDPDAGRAARRFVEDFALRLSRFRPASELSRLNADSRAEVPASRLLRTAVGAGLWAARATDGLLDPTITRALVRAGYDHSLAGARPAPLSDALRAAPPRRPARPDPAALWRRVQVDGAAGVVRRPPGLLLDTGGSGKGLAADAAARLLAAGGRHVVDCGGDIAIGGGAYEVHVEHPLTGEIVDVLRPTSGGVASSGLNVRIWRRVDGSYAHHLLDPASGEPAWTGLVGATALAPTALEAETLAKQALLSGPSTARRVLARYGGIAFRDDGEVERVGPLRRPRLVVRIPAPA